jgi:hypothetical protein
MPEPGAPGRALHEQAAPWLPNEPETGPARRAAAAPASRTKPQPQPLIGQTIATDGAWRPRLSSCRAYLASGGADRYPARRAGAPHRTARPG